VPFTALRATREIAASENHGYHAVIRIPPATHDPILEFNRAAVQPINRLTVKDNR
jgi:hypothetical protein